MKVSSSISTPVVSNLVPRSEMRRDVGTQRKNRGAAEKVPDYFKEFSIQKSMQVRPHLGFKIFYFTYNK